MASLDSKFNDLVSQYGDKSSYSYKSPAELSMNVNDYPLVGLNAQGIENVITQIAEYRNAIKSGVDEILETRPTDALAGEVGEAFVSFQRSAADYCKEITDAISKFESKLRSVQAAYNKVSGLVEETIN